MRVRRARVRGRLGVSAGMLSRCVVAVVCCCAACRAQLPRDSADTVLSELKPGAHAGVVEIAELLHKATEEGGGREREMFSLTATCGDIYNRLGLLVLPDDVTGADYKVMAVWTRPASPEGGETEERVLGAKELQEYLGTIPGCERVVISLQSSRIIVKLGTGERIDSVNVERDPPSGSGS